MSETEQEELAVIVRGYELRLIRCTFTPPPSGSYFHPQSYNHNFNSTHPLSGLIHELLASIESGDYLKALSSDASRLVFKHDEESMDDYDDSVESAERYYFKLQERVEHFIKETSENETDVAFRAMAVLCIAVAAFLGFTQCSMTGPSIELPRCPILFGKADDYVEWDNWARNELMSAGSDLLGKFTNLQYIVFAKMLLMRIKDLLFEGNASSVNGIRSLLWWLARVMLLQQRILAEHSSSLYNQLHKLMGEALEQFGILEKVKSYWHSWLCEGEVLAIVSMAHLEAGIMEYVYGRVDSCRLHLEIAVEAVGLELSLTGVLGFRTKHQAEPKAQMVLRANKLPSTIEEYYLSGDSGARKPDFTGDNADMHYRSSETREASEIFITPKLLVNDNVSGSREVNIEDGLHSTARLTEFQQAVILAQCLLIEKSTPQDDMQKWDMAPYIEAIDSQHSSVFMIHRFTDILRVRWESSRSRTKERSLLMMNEVVEGFYKPFPEVVERIYFSLGVYIPSIPALRKEYGELLVRCGLLGEAIKIFEDLELWDNLIVCYSLMDKKATAVELIKRRLSETPNDPKLWCSLGDNTDNDACYKRALEVSNDKSVRAKRSLARNAYNRGDYEKSKILWESAMAMNSLYPDGWFALGAAALKARDVDKALDGFTRAVQLDPENGEAWNNIACLHMIKKRSKEAFIAFKEALKFKRTSWQMWENFSHVALDVGNVSQALEAIQKVLGMSSNKRVDVEILERIMTEVERRASASESVYPVMADDQNSANPSYQLEFFDGQSGVSMTDRSHETEKLVMLLGKVLQQIVRGGSNFAADIWGLYARWHRLKRDLSMCSEALLKQVRSLQGSDVWKDRMRFKKFAKASMELCKIYIEISLSSGHHKELFAAEMHLKSTIKQGEGFSDTEEFRQLQACYEDVKARLQSTSVST